MDRADNSIKEKIVPAAIWVMALALAALVASPYWQDNRQKIYINKTQPSASGADQ
jgi:hypothetical protein